MTSKESTTMPEKVYFIARGRSLEIAEDFIAARNALCKHGSALSTEFGAKTYFVDDGTLAGFKFEGRAPKGFRISRRVAGMHVPSRKNKAGREVHGRMCEIEAPSQWQLTSRLFGEPQMFGVAGGVRVALANLERLNDDIIISLNVADADVEVAPPEGAILLKRSEYWFLKEAKSNEGGE